MKASWGVSQILTRIRRKNTLGRKSINKPKLRQSSRWTRSRVPSHCLVQNHLTFLVTRCRVSPVKGRVELCGTGRLISLFSIRSEDTATSEMPHPGFVRVAIDTRHHRTLRASAHPEQDQPQGVSDQAAPLYSHQQ